MSWSLVGQIVVLTLLAIVVLIVVDLSEPVVLSVVIVDHRGKDTEMSYTLEPGHSIRVDLVAEGGR